ncbi:Uncharacterised protein [Mycobacterium tuberculosis]|nr:Uncharacterised protein [Mycobacterium tuberculosis]CFR64817.1 Uncharacterised protein [Mycobacterium tuberculosis]CNU19934.1 Uncharacterised protein [Mycobacterium tuberculosis]CNV06555.1 Uncharacterised protein [Mycobacterium tuberculosis]CNV44457.1 Uncharacterised protein [Mycobacterium tuberculosis]
MNDRTINVSNSKPRPMVVPTCPITRRSLTAMDAMVTANTSPALVTTLPVPPIDRMMPVFSPAPISCLNRETKSRL